MVNGACTGVGCSTSNNCVDKLGCPSDRCPDFTIRRHDTKPSFKVAVSDCDGALDLSEENLVLEANMWAKAKLKTSITENDTYFALADNIGFEQIMIGDTIIVDRARLPEQMLVTGFDETNHYVRVERGYNSSQISALKKGQSIRIFRAINWPGEIELVYQDLTQEDGSTVNTLTDTFLVLNWDSNITCLPGCYWLEFKLLKMESLMMSTTTPSFTPSVYPDDSLNYGCTLEDGVSWQRKFPIEGEGFLIRITDSPTEI